ncbi:MAG: TlpA disulfide reductase family protein [Acidobacteriota bacterium]
MKTYKTMFAAFIVSLAFSLSAFAQTSLTSVDGAKVDVQAQRGKVVILAIGASWLPLSGKQADFANVLAKKYSGRSVVVYYVVTDSSAAKSKNFATNEDIRKFAATNKLSVPVLRDPDGAATLKKFGVDQIPSFVVLDKSGNSTGEPFGGIDSKYDITIPISKVVDKML